MANKDLKLQIKNLPNQPGVYQYFDAEGTLIYVGKAKNIKKRVSSYFVNEDRHTRKTKLLVKQITDIQYLVVDSEVDAFLLENNLIKKYQPKYNIQLKDDKTFPWIVIKKEAFPRVIYTRKVIRDGSEYFGPYANVKAMHTLLGLIRELFPLRTCNLLLTKQAIEKNNYKPCLEYHIGNCLGPCIGEESTAQYDGYLEQIRSILKGDLGIAKAFLEKQMMEASETLKFEDAQNYKEKLESLHNYQARSTVVSPTIKKVDVIGFSENATSVFVNYLQLKNGAIVHTESKEFKRKMDEELDYILSLALIYMREKYGSDFKEVVCPPELSNGELPFRLVSPKSGERKDLLDLAMRNAKFYMLDKQRQDKSKDPHRHYVRVMTQLQQDLHLTELPDYIECFDNSNIQGSNPVSACVVFKDGKPSKKDYRHYNIKTVVGPNDFASMEEVVYRRYKRLKDEGRELPKLIIIDGGKGQLSSSVKSLKKLNLVGKIPIIGIAKKLEEIFFPNDPLPLYIDKRSESLKLVQQLRNEAHRFGITHHRNRRSKSALVSELDIIDGIGAKTKKDLMTHFGTISKIRQAGLEDLKRVIGNHRGLIVYNHFLNSSE